MKEAMQTERTVIVTGASRGIGEATALEFAQRGYRVAITARDTARLESLCDRIEQTGTQAIALPGDLHDLEFAKSVVEKTIDRFGRVDVLVNNAVWRELISMREISIESWERTLRLGLTVPAFLARWSAESMQERGQGVIVNISSIMSQQAAGLSPAYIACKGGIESLTYELAALYGGDGIRAVAVCPGAIDTELSRDYSNVDGNSVTAQMERFSLEMISLGRWGQPSEIAKLIAFVASDDASYITGTSILADGGWFRQHLARSIRNRMTEGESS
ncbi:MAG: SDR family oxidoreductase [Planctomycetota bacterium]|nr:SDR family oxidoreductase [Planctomycetota bacterium]